MSVQTKGYSNVFSYIDVRISKTYIIPAKEMSIVKKCQSKDECFVESFRGERMVYNNPESALG